MIAGVSPVPDWLQIAVAWATLLGLGGVILAGVGLLLQWSKGREERKGRAAQDLLDRTRFERQIAALEQAENDRLAAQARRVVPSMMQASTVLPNLWHVRIDNLSTEVMSALRVDVTAVNRGGQPVLDGCRPGNRTSIGDAMADVLDQTMKPTFDRVGQRLREFFDGIRSGAAELGEDGAQFAAALDHVTEGLDMGEQSAALLKEQVKQVIQVNLAEDWPVTMSPGQWAARAFILSSSDLTPRVCLRFDDPAGYTWERTDVTKPRRVREADWRAGTDTA